MSGFRLRQQQRQERAVADLKQAKADFEKARIALEQGTGSEDDYIYTLSHLFYCREVVEESYGRVTLKDP